MAVGNTAGEALRPQLDGQVGMGKGVPSIFEVGYFGRVATPRCPAQPSLRLSRSLSFEDLSLSIE